MGKMPWLTIAFAVGTGLAFSGCAGTPSNKDQVKYKGSTEKTFSRNDATPKAGDTATAPAKDKDSVVAAPKPVVPDATPAAPPLTTGIGDKTSLAPAPLAVPDAPTQIISPPPPSPLKTITSKTPLDVIHDVPGTQPVKREEAAEPLLPAVATEPAPLPKAPGQPLPPIRSMSSPSLLPEAPVPVIPAKVSTPPSFGPPPAVPLPPVDASSPAAGPSLSLPPVPDASVPPPLLKK